MYFIIYIFYYNLGICAVIIYFYCMLKARKNTNNLGYIAYICLHGTFLKLNMGIVEIGFYFLLEI